MTTAPQSFKRQLARGDYADSAAAAAQVVLFPERDFMCWKTKLLVPVALDRAADKMPVLICVTACGMNRAFAYAFSLS